MKNLLIVLLAAAMLFAFAACSADQPAAKLSEPASVMALKAPAASA